MSTHELISHELISNNNVYKVNNKVYSQQFYMNDFKLFTENDSGLNHIRNTVKCFSVETGMDFR